ncbi:unnamed protein product, partial [Allacma fusca]
MFTISSKSSALWREIHRFHPPGWSYWCNTLKASLFSHT